MPRVIFETVEGFSGKLVSRVIDDPDLREHLHVFKDRFHAGKLLAEMLQKHVPLENAVLFAIPAGGVPIGYEISKELNLPLDVIIVRKIQVPWNPEAGFGAVSWDGEVVLNEALVKQLGLSRDIVQRSIEKTMEVVQDRLGKFRGDKPMPEVKNKTVILVDDGLASGYTMLAAMRSVKKRDPKRVVVSIPTASKNAIELLSGQVDDLLCLNIRTTPMFAVAEAYQKWYDLTDEEVKDLLEKV